MTKRWAGLIVIACMVGFTLAVYGALPDRIPTHWNARGEVDDWSGRFMGAFLMPATATAMWLLLPLLRRIDPRRSNYERFDATFCLIVNTTVLFMAVLHVLVLGSALGWAIDVAKAVLAMVGVLFVVLGNYLPRVRSNWWMGIRTPWTLESERVWRDTHRLAGYTFVAGGLVALAATLLPAELTFPIATAGMVGGSLIPVVYSYVVYRRRRTDRPTR